MRDQHASHPGRIVRAIEFDPTLYRPGLVIDAGAHKGRLTLPPGELPGARVIAFEPLPRAGAHPLSLVVGRAVGVR
jgi:hypothetical protein